MALATPTVSNTFLCGVIEGFYGRPWSGSERRCLFQRMQAMQLNAYMYAPKDDSKHRCDWRLLYTAKETEKLRSLIQAAEAAGVTFIYALSPGLDMMYSRQVPLLLRKLGQVRDLGCRAFALLFDDIEPRLRGPDRSAFKSPAEAQCAVTNAAFEHLGRPATFLFCPTEYCGSRARPCVSESSYLATVGAKLAPEIQVMWTGPRVVSKTITAESIKEVGEALKRKPVIWDNLHANDYDMSRLFLGPFSGRGLDLAPLLGGILTNPNCQFEANFVAMSTLAQWHRAALNSSGGGSGGGGFSPEAALEQAVLDWLPSFAVGGGGSHGTEDGCDSAKQNASCLSEKPAAAEATEQQAEVSSDSDADSADLYSDSRSSDSSSDEAVCRSPLTADELLRVCHLFYLPYRHGDWAVRLLDEFHWLRVGSTAAAAASGDRPADWADRAASFDRELASLRLVRRKLNMLANRRLALELLPYVGNVCHVLDTLNAYLSSRKSGESRRSEQQASLSPSSASLCRGGLAAELQRLLPPDASRSLLLHRVFAVRRCSSDIDRGALAELACCTEPRTPADRLLELLCGSGSGESAGFVLEDAFGVCAFACVLPCSKVGKTPEALDFLPEPPAAAVRLPPTAPPPPPPALLHFAVSPGGRCDLSLDSKSRPLRRLLARCLDALQDAGGVWLHCLLPAEQKQRGQQDADCLASDLCDCIGFQRRDCPEAARRGWQLLGRSLL
ncbi:hypothetical protein BOX15_Mlig006327g1 [Macrostomum lignano]|uniref:protein O-GlcNAcase n=1 Tax=Macrostomum lignano TaxID=282301 RepID=A0A267EQY7_9PLAT|nr:hypothetical protein BOX15_Mlig006327g2 [Macrostomum lignano]PAA63911.1 hypothetical protein BOX15_Mlig006327g1 [Macrostomum lignano]